jgi:hypothetical protein
MIKLLTRLIIIPLALAVIIPGQISVQASDVPKEILAASRAKDWALSDRFTRGVVAKISGKQRIVYPSSRTDVGFAHTAVSPSGRNVAFLKTQGDGIRDPVHSKLGFVGIDGSNYTELLDVSDLIEDVAFSHDDRKLAFIGAIREGSYQLVVLDIVSSVPAILFARALPKKMNSRRMTFMNLTSQAWAPNNRDLIFVDGNGSMIVLDTGRGTESDLGAGMTVTWSPDSQLIAYRAATKENSPGDYFLMPLESPKKPRAIISNNIRDPFLGPPLWSPDGRFLLVMRIVGANEQEVPYVLEVKTGKLQAMPIGSMGDMRSWGGKP